MARMGLAKSKPFGEESGNEGIHAHALFTGSGGKAGAKALRNAGDDLSTRNLAGPGNGPARLPQGGQAGREGVLAVLDRLLRRLPIRHAAGQVGKGDQPAAALFGKRAHLKGVFEGLVHASSSVGAVW